MVCSIKTKSSSYKCLFQTQCTDENQLTNKGEKKGSSHKRETKKKSDKKVSIYPYVYVT